jgi:hypothetical protein
MKGSPVRVRASASIHERVCATKEGPRGPSISCVGRFVAAQVRAEAEAAERQVAGELDDAREEALRELRSIAERMQRLEATVHRLGRG